MTQLLENISLAVSGLRANKMRALLTMLGIIIGIGAVIGIVMVGDSMTNMLPFGQRWLLGGHLGRGGIYQQRDDRPV